MADVPLGCVWKNIDCEDCILRDRVESKEDCSQQVFKYDKAATGAVFNKVTKECSSQHGESSNDCKITVDGSFEVKIKYQDTGENIKVMNSEELFAPGDGCFLKTCAILDNDCQSLYKGSLTLLGLSLYAKTDVSDGWQEDICMKCKGSNDLDYDASFTVHQEPKQQRRNLNTIDCYPLK